MKRIELEGLISNEEIIEEKIIDPVKLQTFKTLTDLKDIINKKGANILVMEAIEDIIPNSLNDIISIGTFTSEPSDINKEYALECIDTAIKQLDIEV